MSDLRKGPKLTVVALPGVGHMPAAGEDEREAARVFYVAAKQRLVMGVGDEGSFALNFAVSKEEYT